MPASEPASARAPRLARTPIVIAMIGAVAIAAYTGFRVPNAWSATLQAVSLFDGFHRRFLVGTLLHPLAVAADYDDRVFTGFSFGVLVLLLGVLTVAALRADLWSRRLWIVAWLLLPVGGFLFNEVGYFDQVLYLVLFASLWLVGRGRLVAAACVIALAPLVHELAILTVIPVFGLAALRRVPPLRAVAATAPAVILNGLALVIPPVAPGGIARLEAALDRAKLPYRIDALALFERTQAESWKLYKIHDVLIYVVPVAAALVVAYLILWLADRNLWRAAGSALGQRALRAAVLAASCVAIAAPALAAYAGWDGNRWLFLVIANFFVVVWLSLGDGRRVELGAGAITTLVISVLLLAGARPWYFDHLAPRELGYRAIHHFIDHVRDGSLFEPARE